MSVSPVRLLVGLLVATPTAMAAQAPRAPEFPKPAVPYCRTWAPEELKRNPSPDALRCRFGVQGPGRFGLLSYTDVPVYQPATPMPGTHVVGLPGHAHPRPGESYEEWEWRMLRTDFGPSVHRVHRGLDVLDPMVAERVLRLEARLEALGVVARRLETWRAPERQAYLFQQGRSRPGPLATTTLTSWHSQVDAAGNPAGRAVDYLVPQAHLERFHQVAREVGLESFGADSNDPGHVFLPSPDGIPTSELALLRTLPRVPEVTLATGLPVDRDLPLGGRAVLRERTEEFVREPFIPHLTPALEPELPLPPLVMRVQTAPPPPPGRGAQRR